MTNEPNAHSQPRRLRGNKALNQILDDISHNLHISGRSANEVNEMLNLTRMLKLEISSLIDTVEYRTSIASIKSGGFFAAALDAHLPNPAIHPDRPKAEPRPLHEYEIQLEELEPKIYPIWKELFINAINEYAINPEGSCSRSNNQFTDLFRSYLNIYGRGLLLDIGCGAEGKPGYLSHYPNELIVGLEPRVSLSKPVFELVQGFNEFLPWKNGTFDTVVSGTSLDHVLSIKTSLQEVQRILKPDGVYLVWLASIPGAQPFEPHRVDFAPVDDYHLFHFDQSWIEPIFEEHFNFIDISVIPYSGYDHVFYAMKPREL